METISENVSGIVFRRFGKFSVRELSPEDNAAVRNVILGVRKEIGAHEDYLKDSELNHIHNVYCGDRSTFLVLTYDQLVIGTVGLLPLSCIGQGACELKKFYVAHAWQGLGFGRELITSCLALASQMGYNLCYLETDPFLRRAGKIYRRLGFHLVPEGINLLLPPSKYNWLCRSLR